MVTRDAHPNHVGLLSCAMHPEPLDPIALLLRTSTDNHSRWVQRVRRLGRGWPALTHDQGMTVPMAVVQQHSAIWDPLLGKKDGRIWGQRDAQGRSFWFYALSSSRPWISDGGGMALARTLAANIPDPRDLQGRGLVFQWLGDDVVRHHHCAHPAHFRGHTHHAAYHTLNDLAVSRLEALWASTPEQQRASASRLNSFSMGTSDCPAPTGLVNREAMGILDVIANEAMVAFSGDPQFGRSWVPEWRGAVALAVWVACDGRLQRHTTIFGRETSPLDLLHAWREDLTHALTPTHRTVIRGSMEEVADRLEAEPEWAIWMGLTMAQIEAASMQASLEGEHGRPASRPRM